MGMRMIKGFVAGGIVGATIGMYTMTNMSPWERRRIMKKSKRMINNASNIMRGLNMF